MFHAFLIVKMVANKMWKLSLVVVAIALQGCTTIKYNYAPKTSKFSVPEINVVTTASLGEPLLDQGLSIERDVLVINTPSEIYAYKIKQGTLLKVGEDESFEFFTQNPATGYPIFAGLLMPTPEPNASIVYKKATQEYCITRPADATVCGKLDATKQKETVFTSESFRQTLIYSGRVGSKLRISYREYGNNIARPAFNADAEYDLSEGNIIAYAGAKLEVYEATNTQIKYKIMKNFNTK